ncbi:MAG: hypothetical protein DRJ03_20160 [Chloroflexi bacterium]|nr:MAG: hypothetical protein DRI81_10610 [Chloroflexota bacterium]RLC81462.1 MAG: hypothetical protein DRJ03_20160 [Chloroflexota bacterium]
MGVETDGAPSEWPFSVNGALLYQHGDALGSVRQLTDEAGGVRQARGYSPFGVPTYAAGQSAGSFGFAGEQYDPASGLIYLRARYYDPTVGRFLTRDTYPALAPVPQSLHRYVYCGNDPVNRTDPSGQHWKDRLRERTGRSGKSRRRPGGGRHKPQVSGKRVEDGGGKGSSDNPPPPPPQSDTGHRGNAYEMRKRFEADDGSRAVASDVERGDTRFYYTSSGDLLFVAAYLPNGNPISCSACWNYQRGYYARLAAEQRRQNDPLYRINRATAEWAINRASGLVEGLEAGFDQWARDPIGETRFGPLFLVGPNLNDLRAAGDEVSLMWEAIQTGDSEHEWGESAFRLYLDATGDRDRFVGRATRFMVAEAAADRIFRDSDPTPEELEEAVWAASDVLAYAIGRGSVSHPREVVLAYNALETASECSGGGCTLESAAFSIVFGSMMDYPQGFAGSGAFDVDPEDSMLREALPDDAPIGGFVLGPEGPRQFVMRSSEPPSVQGQGFEMQPAMTSPPGKPVSHIPGWDPEWESHGINVAGETGTDLLVRACNPLASRVAPQTMPKSPIGALDPETGQVLHVGADTVPRFKSNPTTGLVEQAGTNRVVVQMPDGSWEIHLANDLPPGGTPMGPDIDTLAFLQKGEHGWYNLGTDTTPELELREALNQGIGAVRPSGQWRGMFEHGPWQPYFGDATDAGRIFVITAEEDIRYLGIGSASDAWFTYRGVPPNYPNPRQSIPRR